MSTTDQPEKRPRFKQRDDDRRGAAKGTFGNRPYEPTEELRAKVRAYAKTFPVNGEHYIARLIGVSRTTLRQYYSDDIELGRAEMLASVGSQMINRAMNANAESVKGDIDAQKFVLARLGGWTTKVEVGEKAAAPFGGDGPDLSRLTPEQLDEYGRLAAIAAGLDPDEALGDDL